MTQESILIVEDDPVVAKVIEEGLLKLGFRISGSATNGKDALSMTAGTNPDLILMDINLKGPIDGIETARTINSRYRIPIVYLTGLSDQATLSRALDTAPYGYIVKPFDLNTLSITIRLALNERRINRELEDKCVWLQNTVQVLNEGIIVVDQHLRVIFENSAAEKMTGLASREASMKRAGEVLTFHDPISEKPFRYNLEPVLHNGIITITQSNSLLVSKDGARTLIRDSIAIPLKNGRGVTTGAAVILYPKAEGVHPGIKPDSTIRGGTTTFDITAFHQQGERQGEPDFQNDPEKCYDYGNHLMAVRRYEDAIAAYNMTIAINNIHYRAWYAKGTALEKLERNNEALEAYNQALSIHGTNPHILRAKGNLLKKMGEDGEAAKCFSTADLYTK
ncbi:MAG: response regulator [Methanoregulaceae archaeon]|nr:response regulator [Methanoregulaceae archaeon]